MELTRGLFLLLIIKLAQPQPQLVWLGGRFLPTSSRHQALDNDILSKILEEIDARMKSKNGEMEMDEELDKKANHMNYMLVRKKEDPMGKKGKGRRFGPGLRRRD